MKMATSLIVAFTLLGTCAISVAGQEEPTKKPIVSFRSSIQVPPEKDRAKPTTDEEKKDEQDRLLRFAKITTDEARTAATTAYDGEFKYVKIRNYDGNLVYEVEFADGLELAVDAGNKAILRVKFEKGSVLEKARKKAAK